MKRDCERKADELGSDSTAAVMPIRSGIQIDDQKQMKKNEEEKMKDRNRE